MKTEYHACRVADDRRCCLITIHRCVEEESGIHQIQWDTVNLELELAYDPEIESSGKINEIADDLSHHLRERSATCRDREQTRKRKGCGVCLQQLQRRAAQTGRPTDCTAAVCDAQQLLDDKRVSLTKGILTVRSGSAPQSPWLRRRIQLTPPELPATADAQSQQQQQSKSDLKTIPFEPLLVVITLLTMIAGAVLERTGPTAAVWVAYAMAYAAGGFFGLRASIASLREHKIDIDLLMVLAAVGAALVGAPFEGALLLFLFSLSNVLQAFALDRTRSAIKSLSKLRPDTALVLDTIDSSRGRKMPVEHVEINSLVQIKPGDRIPLDGIIERGMSSIDQSSITGESLPVEKTVGSEVLSGTINQDGEFVLRVTKTAGQSTIARVITLVEQAREQQAKTERFLDRFEQYYAIVVILATAAAALLPPLILGSDWADSVYKAITLMVAASPCALIISTPASILSSIGNGARKGILFKGGVHVEQAGGIVAVAFDKTGTLTEGKPQVTNIISFSDLTDNEILQHASALESKSGHVIAMAIIEAAHQRELTYTSPQEFSSESGVGVKAMIDGTEYLLGSPSILDRLPSDVGGLEQTRQKVHELQQQTKTVVVLATTTEILGLIALQDKLRPNVRSVVAQLRSSGIRHIAMLTGDNEAAAKAIAAEAGIDVVFPELHPENKLDAIRQMEQQYGPTAMIGDGVNDAPALAGARLGIAMGAAGTDVALETADIVLLSDDLEKIPYLIDLSKQTRRTLITNISVALGLIMLMIIGIYTIDLPLPVAVIGHEGGTVLVSLNGVRLLMFKQKRNKPTAG